MSKNNNFAGGFLLGTLVGGLAGAVVGIVIGARSNETTSRSKQSLDDDDDSRSNLTLDNTELAEDLEAKMSQLNAAIDEVRQKLNLVNHNQDNF